MVAPRIVKVEAAAREDLDAGGFERSTRGLLVLDDEPEVACSVRLPRLTLHERDELVADVDEGGTMRPPAQRELEDLPVEVQRFLDVSDLERDVVDPGETRQCHAFFNVAGGGHVPSRRASYCGENVRK